MSVNKVIDLMYSHGATHEIIVNAYKMAKPDYEDGINFLLSRGVEPAEMVSRILAHEGETAGTEGAQETEGASA